MSGERGRGGGGDDSRRSDEQRTERRQQQQQGQPQQGQQSRGQGQGQQSRDQGQPPRGQGQPSRGQGRGRSPRGRGQPSRGRGPGGAGGTASGIDVGSLPWVSGAIQGASYYVVGLIAVSFVVFVDFMLISSGSGGTTGGMGGSGAALLYGLGWMFYSAHFVSISSGVLGSQNLIDFIGAVGIPSFVYFLLPPIFLFLAGRSIARSTGHAGMANEQLAARGATAVAGYLPAAALGSVVLTRSGVGPELTTSVLIMGLGYPIVFGALGGYLAKR